MANNMLICLASKSRLEPNSMVLTSQFIRMLFVLVVERLLFDLVCSRWVLRKSVWMVLGCLSMDSKAGVSFWMRPEMRRVILRALFSKIKKYNKFYSFSIDVSSKHKTNLRNPIHHKTMTIQILKSLILTGTFQNFVINRTHVWQPIRHSINII